MTIEDARDIGERIVGRLAASYTTCMAQSITAHQEHFPEEWLRSSEAERDEMHRRLVAALAAAIQVDDATEGGAMVEPDFQPAFEYLHAALSALRGRSEEES